MTPLTVCLVSDSYVCRRPFGGIAIYTQTAAQALTARGHRVHVLVPVISESADYLDGVVPVHYRRVDPLPLIGPAVPSLGESWHLSRALRALHREHHFDLVEFPNFEGFGFVAQRLGIVPSVVRLHTATADSIATEGRTPTLPERVTIWAERRSAQLALGVVTHSRAHRDRLAELYDLANIHLIPHGIRLPAPRTREPARPAVLTLGRLRARKGGATLLAAIPRVLARVPEAVWTVVGAGEDDPLVVEFRAANPGLARDRVAFHRFLEGAELDACYDAATVYASASVYESFGLTFVEAMARGIPVVGCDTSAMPEVIEHERTGLLVPPAVPEPFAEAVARLLLDAGLRARLSVEARRVAAEKFTAERMAADIEAWYREVLTR